MADVMCWCCEYFSWVDNTNYGTCRFRKATRKVHDKVCEDFLILSGLYTQKTIPDYCKNKNITFRSSEKPLSDISDFSEYKKISFE